MRILLATDGSTSSRKAVQEVARRPWPAKSQVKIVSAYGIYLSPIQKPWFIPHDEEKVLEGARKQAHKAVEEAATELKRA